MIDLHLEGHKYPSFQDIFGKLFGSLPIGWKDQVMLFSTTDAIYSLSLIVEREDENYYNFTAGWQEEGESYHNVCGSQQGDTGLYCLSSDTIIRDLYLDDKYNDGSDGWFSERIGTLFEQIPTVMD